MSPNRPSTGDRSGGSQQLVVRVSRELDLDGPDGDVRLRLHPRSAGEPLRGSAVDAPTCARLRREVLDAFDVESIAALRSLGSDRFERRLYLGTAVIEDDAVQFDPDDSLRPSGTRTARSPEPQSLEW